MLIYFPNRAYLMLEPSIARLQGVAEEV